MNFQVKEVIALIMATVGGGVFVHLIRLNQNGMAWIFLFLASFTASLIINEK